MRPYTNILVLEAAGPYSISAIKLLRDKGFLLVAADSSEYAPGLYLADRAVIVPPSSHPEFSGAVESIIRDFEIDLVLPSFESGLEKLQAIEANFVTDFDAAILCKDKLIFAQVCRDRGLPTPETTLLEDSPISFGLPKYIKPRFGAGTRDNFVVLNAEQFKLISSLLKGRGEFVVQDLLLGDHWNIDVLVENGACLRAVPRRDIKQREGNCMIVEIKDYPELVDFSRHVQEALGIKSVFNLEVFEASPGDFVINEINVRFGGGIIFGALSGCDIVSYVVTGNEKYLGILKPAFYSRYYSEASVNLDSALRYS